MRDCSMREMYLSSFIHTIILAFPLEIDTAQVKGVSVNLTTA